MNQKRIVCICNHVSAEEITKILKAGALTIGEIQKFTAAGTGCGRCVREIEALLEKYETKRANNPQLIIRFE